MVDKYRWQIFSFLLVMSIVVAILVLLDATNYVDNWFYNLIISFQSPGLDRYFKYMTFWADVTPMIVIGALVVAWGIFMKKNIGFYLFGVLAVTAIVNQGLKFLFARPRPEGINLITKTGYSFPSGHTMAAVAFYGFLIYMIINSKINKAVKWILNIALVFLIINISISRIYLGVHYLSDIIAGVLISLCILLIMSYVIKRKGVYR